MFPTESLKGRKCLSVLTSKLDCKVAGALQNGETTWWGHSVHQIGHVNMCKKFHERHGDTDMQECYCVIVDDVYSVALTAHEHGGCLMQENITLSPVNAQTCQNVEVSRDLSYGKLESVSPAYQCGTVFSERGDLIWLPTQLMLRMIPLCMKEHTVFRIPFCQFHCNVFFHM